MDEDSEKKTSQPLQPPRERLIDAAIESVYQHGYNETTIAKISDLADMSLGSVHYHFSGKEELLEHAMRKLLQNMHSAIVADCSHTDSPRTKLWAVIQSVLGDEQSEEKTRAVWLSFWLQAEYDEKLHRVRDIYNRRLISNVRAYLRHILLEIGASDVDARVHSGAMMLIAQMHGVWISYALKEDLAQDLAHGRLLVWECLEMLLSRAREPLENHQATVATSAGLLSDISMEVVGKDVSEDKLMAWGEYAPAGMSIYIPHFRNGTGLSEKARMAARVIDAGYAPSVHIAARNIADERELDRIVAGMCAIGVRDFLLLGGGETDAVGNYQTAGELLQSGVLQRHSVTRVGFAGHPEKHPDQPAEFMRQALAEKIAIAKEMKLPCYIVTQFCFAPRPFYDFLDWCQQQQFNVPVRLGIAGRVNAAKLMKFAATCGIGRSLSFLRRQFGKAMSLVNYSPEGLLAELSAGIALRNYDFPIGIHFYPFGASVETLALAAAAGLETDTADLSNNHKGE